MLTESLTYLLLASAAVATVVTIIKVRRGAIEPTYRRSIRQAAAPRRRVRR